MVINYYVYYLVEASTTAIVQISPKRLSWNDKTDDKTKENFMRFNIANKNKLDDLAMLAGNKEEIMRRENFPESFIEAYIASIHK